MSRSGYLRRKHSGGEHSRYEQARRNVEYATVKGLLANFTDGAILVSTEKLTIPAWVPRQALEPASRAMIYRKVRGDEIEVQVELKMAQEKGLL